MSKHFKFRSLMSIIYALIMLLPVTSVAFRCAYTIFNKNAYESYYGETINESEMVPYDYNELRVNEQYSFIVNSTDTFEGTLSINGLIMEYKVRNGDYVQLEGYTILNFFQTNEFYFRGEGLTAIYRTFNNTEEIKFTFTSYSENNFSGLEDKFYKQEYNKYSYLDNAFEYSLYEFVGNNGRGVLNLTDWFTSVFLQSSTHTQLYLDFINWYMNYTLLVSCVYILYLVLMWFVSLARRLLTNMIEKGGELK